MIISRLKLLPIREHPPKKRQLSNKKLIFKISHLQKEAISKKEVAFKNESGLKGDFISIHPDKDSLAFQGESAFYDLKTNELQIGGVEVIQTCDAFVYTDDGEIGISKGGIMDTIVNAKIVANTENKYHVINRATVNLIGKKDYRATGFYEYNIGKREQEIEFANIIGTRVGKGKRSEKKTVTRADGEVTEVDSFYIDHKTEFRGKIQLNAESKNLSFNGFARLDAPNMPSRHWFSVRFAPRIPFTAVPSPTIKCDHSQAWQPRNVRPPIIVQSIHFSTSAWRSSSLSALL